MTLILRLGALLALLATVPAGGQDPSALPGRGLAEHPFLYCGEWDTRRPVQTMYLVEGGRVAWTYTVPNDQELDDCTRMSNGHIVFARRTGASEVTPDKQIVWNYEAPAGFEIHTAQPIGLDRVLVMQNGDPATLLVIEKATGRVVTRLVLRTRRPDQPHGQFRHVRMTRAGTFLVAHMDLGRVVEYDKTGTPIWSVEAPSAWAAVRLRNGNTLISGNQQGYVREVNEKGETVWDLQKDSLPGFPLYTVQEVARLANGHTLINNWSGSLPVTDWSTVTQLIEVTPDRHVVWALRDWQTFGPASSTQLLDEPGIPENGAQDR